MMRGLTSVIGALCFCAPIAAADVPETARQADVVFLGEVHDNPAHHAVQADWVAALSPTAVVWEMLTAEQAARVLPEMRGNADQIESAVDWAQGGWPDFDMYAPIFTAAGQAAIVGAAMPRGEAMGAAGRPPADVFGPGAEQFGLTVALPDEQQTAREDMQFSAHCDAMPREMMGMMVDIQRLRDARIAKAALEALEAFGRPVVVITGNGHARRDWGATYMLEQAGAVTTFALGQSEDGVGPSGTFDLVIDAPAVDRPDPCLAFKTSN